MQSLNDDEIYHIGKQLLNIHFLGEIALALFGGTCRRHLLLMNNICTTKRERWLSGFNTFYEWRVNNFKTLTTEMYSPVFSSAHGHQWKILLFPKGNKVTGSGPSLYLDVANSIFLPQVWSREVNFIFRMTNHIGIDIVSDKTKHTFSNTNSDWGYRSMTGPITDDDFNDKFLDEEGTFHCAVEIHCKPFLPVQSMAHLLPTPENVVDAF